MRADVRRALVRAACVCAVAGLAASLAGRDRVVVHAQRSDPADVLTAGAIRERTLSAGHSHSFALHLEAGQFLQALASPSGIDVAVTLVAPDGRTQLTVDLADDGVTSEPVLAIADASGQYELKVNAVHTVVPAGRYRLTIEAIRQPGDSDPLRVDAMRLLEAAVLARASGEARTWQADGHLLAGALAAFSRAGDRENEARVRYERGLRASVAATPDARTLTEDALSLYRALGDRVGIAKALLATASPRIRVGEITEALEVTTEALALSKATANLALEAGVHNRRGVIYGQTGDPERAVDEFVEALRLARLMQLERLEYNLLNNLGIATKDLGDYPLSLDYYTQALAQARARRQRSDEANILNNLGNLQRKFGEHEQALRLHRDALVLAREVGNAEHEARALNTLGSTLYRLGNFREALDDHERALAIRRRLNDPAGEASSLDGAGLAWHRLGDSGKAIEYLNEALEIRRAIAARLGEGDTLRHLALVERDRGNLAAALDFVEAAVELTDSLRGRVVSPDRRASFVASEQECYELQIDILMQLRTQSGDAAFAARALEASERGRARVLLESLAESQNEIRKGIDPALLASERTAQHDRERASTRLSQLLSQKAAASEVAAARGLVETTTVAYRQVQVRIRQESPGYAALTQPRALTTREIQNDLLDADTLLLEYALGEKRSWLWIASSTGLASVALPPRAEIDAAARRVYGLVTARQPRMGESQAVRSARIERADRDFARESAVLGRMLLGDAAARLGAAWRGKRLLIVAPEVLQYIPFSALADPIDTARRLVAEHEIVHAPSASVLAEVRRQTEKRPRPTKQLAVLADPVFEADDPRLAAVDRPATGGLSAMRVKHVVDRPDVSPVARAMRSMAAAEGTRAPRLSRLPFSREEARAIMALVPADQRLEATDFQASRATALRRDLADYRLVHFATHGFFNGDQPELSGLVLSLVDRNGRPQDGFLRLTDIYNLHLPADVVVLSACQSALGKDIRGEGLVGLTRGFMYAGARRVVASLWEVDDLATAELMRRFYEGMLRRGLRPAAALRAAQRTLARDPRYASPFFWSAFQLQGEWR